MQFNLALFLVIAFIACNLTLAADSNSTEPQCATDVDCNHGKCVNATVCVCERGYVTHKGNNCNYQQKPKLVAFILSIILGSTGADWFYLANGSVFYIVLGSIKLATGVLGLLLPCILGIVGCLRADDAKKPLYALIIVTIALLSLANAAWWLADWIRILLDTFKDGNGVSLKPW